MDYCLGSGDGTASVWDHAPDVDVDGDGVDDGVLLDFDGDGLRDDALVDLDADGSADHAVLNFADDPHWFTDDGSGVWAIAAAPAGRAGPTLRWFGLDGTEQTGAGPLDFDGDGGADDVPLDTDADGLADRMIAGAGRVGYVDVDGDGRFDVKLVDLDGDGAADGAAPL